MTKDNMTDSQKMRALAAQLRQEMQEITQPLKADVEALKRWQAEQQKEKANLKRVVIRFAKGLLGLVDEE